MKYLQNQRGIAELVAIALVGLAVIAAGIGIYLRSHGTTSNNTGSGTIVAEQFSTTVDGKGAAVHPAVQFSPTTPKIYTVVKLKQVKPNSRVEYIRYLNGKYLGRGALTVTQADAQNAHFAFGLKPGKSRAKGTYKIKVYLNGHYQMSSQYSVK